MKPRFLNWTVTMLINENHKRLFGCWVLFVCLLLFFVSLFISQLNYCKFTHTGAHLSTIYSQLYEIALNFIANVKAFCFSRRYCYHLQGWMFFCCRSWINIMNKIASWATPFEFFLESLVLLNLSCLLSTYLELQQITEIGFLFAGAMLTFFPTDI